MGNPNVTVNISLLTIKELTYKGSFRYGVRNYTNLLLNLHYNPLTSLVTIRLPSPWLLQVVLT